MALLLLLKLLVTEDPAEVIHSSWAWDIDACSSSLQVRRPELFDHGNRVLVHVPVCRHRVASDRHAVGAWSWNVIDTIIAGRLFLRYQLPTDVAAAEHVQVVRAMEPRNKIIDQRVVPQPWNGYDGGVVAIWSDDTLTIDAPITASGKGYFQLVRSWNTADTLARSFGDSTISEPGSGGSACPGWRQIDTASMWLAETIGGKPHNAGGAGGTSAGAGGQGGKSSTAFADVFVASGRPRRPSDDGSRLLFGSSGASGHGNDLDAGRGGSAGGAVVIRTRHLRLNRGSNISADGINGRDARHDAAGGGGGAGTIMIDALTVDGDGLLSVRGGHGGSTHSTLFLSGPGGGGGGGSILTTVSLPSTVRCAVDGGSAGDAHAQYVADSTLRHAAQQGSAGTLNTAIPSWQPSAARVQHMRLRRSDSVVPAGSQAILWSEGAERTLWLDDLESIAGDSVRTQPVEAGRWYRARMFGKDGCTRVDSIFVRVMPASTALIVSIGDLRARAGDSVDVYLNVRTASIPARPIEGVAYVSTHPNLLLPIGAAATVSRGRTRIQFPFRLGATTATYRRDQLQAALGDSSSVQLSIDSVRLSDASITVQRRHGRFTLDGICQLDGRRRLFSNTPVYSIRGRSVTTMAAEVLISDVLGRPLAQYRSIDGKGLTFTINPELDGLVFVVFYDETSLLTVPLWLQRASGL